MMIQLHGTYKDQTITLLEPLNLPEGTRVRVSIEPQSDPTAQDEAFLKALENAPEDDEPLTPEDARAIEEAEQDIREGRVHTLEDVRKELGL